MKEPRHIQLLPEFIANQIAAGEVVQRPESVVKELIENAFDAQATTIMVVVKDAGKQMIYVVDNGVGMTRDDLSLACRRHATSKVYTADDLDAIYTFGFRGEALASIASVANIEIRTIRRGEELGWKYSAEPNKEGTIEPFVIDCGTQIFVRNLFFNIPARKKFLRTNLTEFRYISDTMVKFALAKPNIRFIFYDNDTLIFDVKQQTLRERIEHLMGQETCDAMLQVEHTEGDIRVWGYIGIPSITRQTKSGQYLFLNGRSIQSKSLSFAIYSAYEHLLEKSKQPLYVINIELDPHQYDVNVHPQKHEVKFEDEKYMFNLLNKVISQTLADNNIVQDTVLEAIAAVSPFERVVVNDEETRDRNVLLVNKSTGEIIDKKQQFEPKKYPGNYSSYHNPQVYKAPAPLNFNVDLLKPIAGTETRSETNIIADATSDTAFDKDNLPHNKEIDLLRQFINDELNFSFFQIHNKYLLIEVPDGVLIFDQHAAHERVLYERILHNMNKLFANSQQLLFPETLALSVGELAIIREIDTELHELGYEYNYLDNGLEMLAVPLDDAYNHDTISIKEIVGQYEEEQRIRISSKRDYLAASYACKAAIKTGKTMTKEETIRLFRDLLNCKMPYCCPHGRPVSIELSLTQFDKLFGRII